MREALLKLRAEIEQVGETANDAASTVELDQTRVGRLSRMDALQAQAMSKASIERRELMLRKIDAALKRIDEGRFGLCLSCDEPINQKRLDFDPTVTLCIECASRAERT